MTITIESSRFGTVEIAPETVVEFPDGLIGLGGSRYALLGTDAGSPFLWLHSLEDSNIALPVTNPRRFFPDFSVELSDEDAARLAVDDTASMDVYVTVRAAPVLEDVTANLKAPILIHAGRAHQVINQVKGANLRAQLFPSEAKESEQAC
ncbi:MAG: flagellar assembly protein FliW [Solirubrobacteraceae bacterium]|jgi:flagellar assembly factor FliW